MNRTHLRSLCLGAAFAVGTGFSASAFEIEPVVSPGGIEAWLVEDHSVPLTSISFAFRGGSAADPAGQEGLAEFVAGLLNEGAGALDSQAFQNRIADLSIDLEFSAGRDEFRGSIRMLTENAGEAVDLLHLALTEPRFDEDAVERIRGQLLTILATNATDPGDIASRTWRETAFPDHPYGRPPEGTPETIAPLGADDFRSFVARNFARDNLVVGVVGDIDAATLGPILDRLFGDLPATADLPAIPETAPEGAGRVLVVERPIPQSVVIYGGPAIKRDDPDFYIAAVLLEAVGGGFGSRLTESVREDRGLAYSVGASLSTYEHAGLVLGQAGTRNERVAEMIALINEAFADVAANGLTDEEIADARSYIVGSYPLRMTSSMSTAGALISIQLAGLPIDYIERRAELFDAVTSEDVKRVAARLLDPANMLYVVVGTPVGVDGEIQAN
ncbi:MAG: pitrilysin family protein [Rhodospirillaceae bacterium]|nr:pitrilysin family protein [Rhodospirillaceae bacterium]